MNRTRVARADGHSLDRFHTRWAHDLERADVDVRVESRAQARSCSIVRSGYFAMNGRMLASALNRFVSSYCARMETSK
jgi:hypothetical protein